jgi:hypothetical protein
MYTVSDATITYTSNRRFIQGFKNLHWTRKDTRFHNAWGNLAGLPESGGTFHGQVTITRLAFQSMRQMRLTAAGRDVQWYSINGYHVPADSFVYIDGDVHTAESLFNS